MSALHSVHRRLFEVAGGDSPIRADYFYTASLDPRTHELVPMELPRVRNRLYLNRTCKHWVGRRNEKGYGVIDREGRPQGAHRHVWGQEVGPIPEGFDIAHLCGVRDCVNPAHLYLASPWLNSSDQVADGTTNRGTRNGSSKLTDEQVVEIRELYTTGEFTQQTLAEKFIVSRQLVSKIVLGQVRTEAGGPIARKAKRGNPIINRESVRQLVGWQPPSNIAKCLGCSYGAVHSIAAGMKLDLRPKVWFSFKYPELRNMTIADFLRKCFLP